MPSHLESASEETNTALYASLIPQTTMDCEEDKVTKLVGIYRKIFDLPVYLASVLYFAIFFFLAALFLIGQIILLPLTLVFDKEKRVFHLLSCLASYHFFSTNPLWRIRFHGAGNLPADGPYILVANHQSVADILVLSGLGADFKWVAKRSIFCIPITGQIMAINGYICTSNGTFKDTRRMLDECTSWLRRGVSVLMFPEGTRSPDGRLLPFKSGPFRLAADCNLPIVPIVVHGTHSILPKCSRKISFRGDVDIAILPPVYPARWQHCSSEMREHVWNLMNEAIPEVQDSRSSSPVLLAQ